MTIFDDDRRLPRGSYIGGHDVVAIMGLHPFSTAGDVYAHMVLGRKEDISARPAVRRGRIIEPGLIAEIAKDKGLTVRQNLFVLDDEVPYLGGTVDAIDEGRRLLLEVTTTHSRNRASWGPTGTDDASTYKWMQAQFYLGLLGWDEALIACFVTDTDELLEYPVRAKPGAIEEMRDAAERFYLEHVGPKVPPDPSVLAKGSDANALLEALYAKENGSAVEATADMVNAAFAYDAARQREKEAIEAKDAAAAVIKAGLGDASTSKWDGGRVQWTSSKLKPSVDYQAVTETLAQRLGLASPELAKVLGEHTKTRDSSRALRVFLNKKKDGAA